MAAPAWTKRVRWKEQRKREREERERLERGGEDDGASARPRGGAGARQGARAQLVERPLAWAPQPGPQTLLLRCPIPDVLYGGARGGGKSDGVLGDWGYYQHRYGGNAKGLILRRSYPELEELELRAQQIFPQLDGVWRASSRSWTFPNGSLLRFRHLETEEDATKYQGHGYTYLGVDEVGQFSSPVPIDLLLASMRSPTGIPVVRRMTANPGGIGHSWLKKGYIDPAPPLTPFLHEVDLGPGIPKAKTWRVFIPSLLENNQILVRNDPAYEQRILAAAGGRSWLAKAWRYGDWDILAGGYFEMWSREHMVLRPFPIPKTWTLRRGLDWGRAKPASFGIWAISDGGVAIPELGGRVFPRGSMIRVQEWYVANRESDKPNVGALLSNAQLGEGIAKICGMRRFAGCVADPSIFADTGGPTVYSQICAGADNWQNKHMPGAQRVRFAPAINDRIGGWTWLSELMSNAGGEHFRERPGIYTFDHCSDSIRTIPTLPRSVKKPEDVETDAEDHAADEWRYVAMTTNPQVRGTPQEVEPTRLPLGVRGELAKVEDAYN